MPPKYLQFTALIGKEVDLPTSDDFYHFFHLLQSNSACFIQTRTNIVLLSPDTSWYTP